MHKILFKYYSRIHIENNSDVAGMCKAEMLKRRELAQSIVVVGQFPQL